MLRSVAVMTRFRLARLVASAELWVTLAIAPALVFPTPWRMLALAVVPLLWIGARMATGRAVPSTPMNPALWLMLAMVGVSLYATFDVRISLGKVAGVALGVTLFWALARWATTRARLTALACAFLLAGGGLAAIGLAGTNWFEKFPVLAAVVVRLPRIIRGVPGAEAGFHPNAVAGCLVLFVPLQVALLGAGWHRDVVPAGTRLAARGAVITAEGLLLLLTGGTLLLTQSRGAWLGTAFAAAVFLAWRGRPTRALVAAAAAALVMWAAFVGPGRLANLAISGSGPGMAENAAGRVELWSRAIEGIQDFPLTGMGMNAFRTVMPALYPTFLTSPDFDVAHAHNHLLQAALDIGLPGLVAYVAIWLMAGLLLIRVHRQGERPSDRSMAAGLGAGFIAHFVFSLTDAIPLGAKPGVLFWLALAMAVALHQVTVPRRGAGPDAAGGDAFPPPAAAA